MSGQPLAEVFGFPVDDFSQEAERHRQNHLCPFHNGVPNCTKDKVEDPLGVCSIFSGSEAIITCPIRFRQDWRITRDVATFFFPKGTTWIALPEVRLSDKAGRPAGNIDLALVAYDENNRVTDFGALEVQAVYITGNVRQPFEYYMQDPSNRVGMNWPGVIRPDFLSSSRKRLAPQLLYKGGILNAWKKKLAIAVDIGFFSSLPPLPAVVRSEADMAIFVYELLREPEQSQYQLSLRRTVYTMFQLALTTITQAEAGQEQEFVARLQTRLAERLRRLV